MRTSNDIKRRPTGKVSRLPEAQRDQVISWLRNGLTYEMIAKLARESFGVELSSQNLSTFYFRHIAAEKPLEITVVHKFEAPLELKVKNL